MKHLQLGAGPLILIALCHAAMAQQVPDLKGTWTPTEGAHIVDGQSRHAESGTAPVAGDKALRAHTSDFVFRFDGQDGRTFWGSLSSAKVSERLIGAISVDGKRFVMADEDGTFDGTVIDSDTLDYCYVHATATDRAVACGLLVRKK
jgi:hypothetical protein